jgi:carbonic anhydrase/acetyltransferase-like protein (isoleucine patch superfamily)
MTEFGPMVRVDAAAYIHPSAQIYGDVEIGEGSSVWINVAMRAESFSIGIGAHTNIQDFTMIHVGAATPTLIGNYCSITHHCTIHGCTIGDNCLIGINATIMDGAVIGENSIVAGGAFVREGAVVPPNSIVMGVPAQVTKTRNNWIANRMNAFLYEQNAEAYARGEHRAWADAAGQTAVNEKMNALREEFDVLFGEVATPNG